MAGQQKQHHNISSLVFTLLKDSLLGNSTHREVKGNR